MPSINLQSLFTVEGGFSPTTRGKVTFEYWAGHAPFTDVVADEVRFSAPIVVPLTGEPVEPVLLPTGGKCCVKVTVADNANRRYIEDKFVEIPDVAVVDFGDLIDVDPTTYEPSEDGQAAWDAAVAAAAGFLADGQAAAVSSATSASAASEAASAADEAAQTALQVAGEVGPARDVAVQAAQDAEAALTGAVSAEAAAQAAAASVNPGVAGGTATLDGGARLPEAQVPERLSAASLAGTIDGRVTSLTPPAVPTRFSSTRPFVSDKSRLTVISTSTGYEMAPYIQSFITSVAGWAITVDNLGAAGGRTQFCMARMGLWEVRATGTIPATGAATIVLTGVPTTGRLRAYTVNIAGIIGTLSGNNNVFTFTRATPGAPLTVTDAVAFMVPTAGQLSTGLGNVTLLSIGKNNSADGLESIIASTQAIIDALTPITKYIVLMGHFNDTGSSSTTRALWAAVNAWMAEYATTHEHVVFVDLSAYVTGSQVWIDTGITPTATDLTQQAAGDKPASLSADAQHLNAAGYTAASAHVVGPALAHLLSLPEPFTGYASDTFTGNGDMQGRVFDAGLGGAPITWYRGSTAPATADTSGGQAVFGTNAVVGADIGTHESVRVSAVLPALPSSGTLILNALKATGAAGGTVPAYRLSISSTGGVSLSRRIAAGTTTLATSATAYTAGKKITLEVVRNTTTGVNTIRGLIDGVEVTTATNNEITSGSFVGIGTTGPATLDNFEVQKLASTA